VRDTAREIGEEEELAPVSTCGLCPDWAVLAGAGRLRFEQVVRGADRPG
jgi:hypothetical protein